MIECTKLERAIVKRLNAILKTRISESASDREWTSAIKRQLGKLEQEMGYSVCTSYARRQFEPEWLYDLVWYTAGSRGKYLENLQLIVEIEWAMNYGDVSYDFEKLMAGRADLRMLVFQAINPKIIEEYHREFIRDIATFKYSLKGDRYFFTAYDQKNATFIYRLFEY
jgi:hypothetical protein